MTYKLSMEPLSSFAISLAAGIALEVWHKQFNSVDKQISNAFQGALKEWSKNKDIRDRNENNLKKQLIGIINTQQLHNTDDIDIKIFIDIFKKELPKFPLAYDYLKEINDHARYTEIIEEIRNLQPSLNKILENIEYDPRELEKYLNNLPFSEGIQSVNNAINNLYNKNEIDLKLRESIQVATNKIYDRTNELEEEIKYLKQEGETGLVDVLEKIKRALEGRKPNKLEEIYSSYVRKEKEDKIKLLKELIATSSTMFAYKETINFYEELLLVNPTADTHFSYAYFLQEYNFYIDAVNHYQEALQIYRDLAKENPRRYEIDYAKSLILGVALFQKEPKNLNIAEETLRKYENVPLANKFLEIINEIRNNE